VTTVRVPASTANLGPGFDAIGMALAVTADIGVIGESTGEDELAKAVDEHHPASVAFRRAGGVGHLWVRSPIPIGRGLGFSGAMRVGGAAAAMAQTSRDDADNFASHRRSVLAVAAELEGHADNAAASLHGGIVVTDGVGVIRIATPLQPDVVVWIPPETTSTASSRTDLPATVPFADAVFNIGRTASLVAALAAGDVGALATATEDRLHQGARLATAPASLVALEAGMKAGAWCGWLSGSGPTIALLAGRGEGAGVAGALPDNGRAKVLAIDWLGTVVVDCG